MTYIIADTVQQCRTWADILNIRSHRYLRDLSSIVGTSRSTPIIAVGPCKEIETLDRIADIRTRGYTVTYRGR